MNCWVGTLFGDETSRINCFSEVARDDGPERVHIPGNFRILYQVHGEGTTVLCLCRTSGPSLEGLVNDGFDQC